MLSQGEFWTTESGRTNGRRNILELSDQQRPKDEKDGKTNMNADDSLKLKTTAHSSKDTMKMDTEGNVAEPGDTTDFFMEVNEQTQDSIEHALDDEDITIHDDDMNDSLQCIEKAERIIAGLNMTKLMIGICTCGKETERDDKYLLQVLRLASSMGRPDVAEVYSPPRVAALAERFGLMPGFSLDLSVLDPDDGLPWDFH